MKKKISVVSFALGAAAAGIAYLFSKNLFAQDHVYNVTVKVGEVFAVAANDLPKDAMIGDPVFDPTMLELVNTMGNQGPTGGWALYTFQAISPGTCKIVAPNLSATVKVVA